MSVPKSNGAHTPDLDFEKQVSNHFSRSITETIFSRFNVCMSSFLPGGSRYQEQSSRSQALVQILDKQYEAIHQARPFTSRIGKMPPGEKEPRERRPPTVALMPVRRRLIAPRLGLVHPASAAFQPVGRPFPVSLPPRRIALLFSHGP
jgi:hypothetical protein